MKRDVPEGEPIAVEPDAAWQSTRSGKAAGIVIDAAFCSAEKKSGGDKPPL
jgi:hypothetical protein